MSPSDRAPRLLAIIVAVAVLTFLILQIPDWHRATPAPETLPSGPTRAWRQFTGRQLARAIVRQGDAWRVRARGGAAGVVIPIEAPYEVQCDAAQWTITVLFHPGDGMIAVPILNAASAGHPPLSGDRDSVGGAALMTLLCEDVHESLTAATAPAEAP